jgi:hypothetical protein
MIISNALSQPLRRDLSTDALNRLVSWLTKLYDRGAQLAAQLKPLMTNATYSDVGRAEQIAALATDAIPQFAWLGVLLDELAQAIARLRGQLFDLTSPIKDAVLREMRNQEIRSTLWALSINERDIALLHAGEQDQLEILSALLDSPAGPMVSDDAKTRVLEARARRLQPELYATLADTLLLQESLTAYAEQAAMLLTDLGGDRAAVAKALRAPLDEGLDVGGRAPIPQAEWAAKILQSVA